MFENYFLNFLKSPEIYENPEEFIPERWENSKTSNFAYIPFGLGARVCVGNNFSLAEQKIFLSTLLQKFSFSLVDKNEIIQEETSTLMVTPKKCQIKFTTL
jgi:cytochrome P450